MLNYKIKNNKGFLRWENYKDFIKNIYSFGNTKKNSYAIITIHFNNVKNIIKLFDYIEYEKRKDDIDIIIIENSTDNEEKLGLQNFIKIYDTSNITIIETIENLGSAGAYALGIEYIFSKDIYTNIFIYEDDVVLLEKGTFSEMMKESFDNNIVYINGPTNTGCNKSWLVQIGLYPIEFLTKVGIPNPTYFTRSEDLEWKERFEIIQKKYGYNEKIVNRDYFHPYLKKNNGQTWFVYFSLRNHLFTSFKWFKSRSLFYGITLFLYIWYAFAKLFIEKRENIFQAVSYAIIDFIIGNYSFQNNQKRLQILRKQNMKFPACREESINIIELNNMIHNKFLLSEQLFSNVDRNKFLYSNKIQDFLKNGVIIGGYFSPLYPLFILSKNIISINEYDFQTDTYNVSFIQNSPQYLKVFISFIFALIVFIIILPLLLIKGFILFFKI